MVLTVLVCETPPARNLQPLPSRASPAGRGGRERVDFHRDGPSLALDSERVLGLTRALRLELHGLLVPNGVPLEPVERVVDS